MRLFYFYVWNLRVFVLPPCRDSVGASGGSLVRTSTVSENARVVNIIVLHKTNMDMYMGLGGVRVLELWWVQHVSKCCFWRRYVLPLYVCRSAHHKLSLTTRQSVYV